MTAEQYWYILHFGSDQKTELYLWLITIISFKSWHMQYSCYCHSWFSLSRKKRLHLTDIALGLRFRYSSFNVQSRTTNRLWIFDPAWKFKNFHVGNRNFNLPATYAPCALNQLPAWRLSRHRLEFGNIVIKLVSQTGSSLYHSFWLPSYDWFSKRGFNILKQLNWKIVVSNLDHLHLIVWEFSLQRMW